MTSRDYQWQRSIPPPKSEFTHDHSRGLEEKVCAASRFYGYEDEDSWKMCIAAHLQDLGKLAVSNSILDKPGALTDQEFE